MKKRHVMIPLLLLAVVILAITVFAVDSEIPQASTTYREISYTYVPGGLKQEHNCSSAFPYADIMLLGDANEFSGDIAKASVALASVAYDRNRVNSTLEAMGYTAYDNADTYNRLNSMTIWDNDYVAYTIAYRDVQYNGENYRIYCVPVKGTGGNAEWFSNYNLGTGPEHEGFRIAAESVYHDLIMRMAYDGGDQFDMDHRVIWLTGHSRGAAVSNLVAGWLLEKDIAKSERVFGYTFACPANSKNADTSLTNIYNFNNPNDLVPLMPIEDWGYKRYGVSLESMSDLIADDVAFQFKRISGETMDKRMRSTWQSMLHALAPTQNDFYGEQALFEILAWIQGGKSQISLQDLLIHLGFENRGVIIDKLAGATGLPGLKTILRTLTNNYGQESKSAEQMVADTEGMTPESVARYLSEHSSAVQSLAKAAGMDVVDLESLKTASQVVNRTLIAAQDITDIIASGDNLFFDANGNMLTAISHGHTQLTYTVWMNAEFYGRNGWYGYPNACSFTIDNTKFVGSSCFYNCTGLTSVTIADGVEQVNEYAFSSCTGMKTLRIDSSDVNLKQSSFSGCTGLTTVTIPVDLAPENNAFNGCKNVQTIHYTKGKTGVMADRQTDSTKLLYYQKTLEYISRTALITVDFESGILHIGNFAFGDYRSDSSSTTYTNGVLQNVRLPDTVKTIGSYAFGCQKLLKSVLLPDNVQLGSYCFFQCVAMTEIPMNSTLAELPSGCFRCCTGIKEITIPSNIKIIGSSCFSDCTGLTSATIKEGVESVEQYAFSNCTGLKTVTIPVDLAPANYAFSGCTNVETVHYTKGKTGVMVNRQTTSGKPMYYNATLEYISRASLTNVDFDDGVTCIGEYAFFNCSRLSRIDIPDSVTNIKSHAFYACSGLQSVTIGNCVTSIGDFAFRDCSRLTAITIPVNITSVGYGAFEYCTGLTTVTLPVDLAYKDAFYDCKNVKTVHYTKGKTGVMLDRQKESASKPMYYHYTLEYSSRTSLTSVDFENGITHIGDYVFGDDAYDSKIKGVLRSVRLPETVESIGAYAFSGQKLLQKIELPENVQLGVYCFAGCIGLTELPMNSTLSELPNCCFLNCTGLTEIMIPSNIKTIRVSCFNGCMGIRSVTLKEGIEAVEPQAFKDCKSIQSIIIESPDVDLQDNAFWSCTGLTTVTMPVDLMPENGAFRNCLNVKTIHYTKGKTGVMADRQTNPEKPMYYQDTLEFWSRSQLENVDFESGITHIGNYAFGGERSSSTYSKSSVLQNVRLPYTVESIGVSAFSGQKLLQKIELPDNVKLGSNCFMGCIGLKELPMNNTLSELPNGCFDGCTGLKDITIPANIKTVGSNCFSDCTGVTSVTIMEGVENVEKYAFIRCKNIKALLIESSDVSFKKYAFSVCTGLATVTMPVDLVPANYTFYGCTNVETISYTKGKTGVMADRQSSDSSKEMYRDGTLEYISRDSLTRVDFLEGVTCIAEYVFDNFKSLMSVYFSASVTNIGDAAFYGCSSLTTVTIGNNAIVPNSVTRIGKSAFNGCCGLTDVAIGNSVTSIGDFAFNGCRSLMNVTVPDSVMSIGKSAFNGCSGLTNVTIGNNVKSIDDYTFSGCSSLTKVIIPDSVTSIGDYAFHGCSSLTNVDVPDSVSSVGNSAFHGCSGLTTVMIGKNVRIIGNYAFEDCSGLMNVSIPDSVTSIGNGAFGGCSSLTNIEIPDSVTSIGDVAFVICSSLEAIDVSDDNPSYYSENGVLFTRDRDTLLTYPAGRVDNNYTIPSSVICIGHGAFGGCSHLASVIIPDSVKNIDDAAFYGCSGMTRVEIGNSVTSIGDYAFSDCSSLTSVNIPDMVKSINDCVFSGCSGLTTVTIGNGVSSVGNYAFEDCSALTSISIPDGVTSIGIGAFAYCSKLTSLTLPSSLTNIASDSFYCTGLTDVYYTGSCADWQRISIYGGECLWGVKLHCSLPHADSVLRNEVDPSCAVDGYTGDQVCPVCGELIEEGSAIPALGHSWDEGVVTLEPTEASEGVKTFTCTVCGETRTEVIPKLSNPFTDVAEGKFYHDPVLWAISQNPQITTGVTDTTFMPDRICTRAHVVTFLWRANGCPEPTNTTNTFKDVPNGKYYTKAVLWAAETGITTGYSDGTFRPDDECTRGQVVTFLWRAKGQPAPTNAANPFSDVAAGKYYTTAVLWALENNITKGRTASTFGPDDACTRGHVVTFLYRAYA